MAKTLYYAIYYHKPNRTTTYRWIAWEFNKDKRVASLKTKGYIIKSVVGQNHPRLYKKG